MSLIVSNLQAWIALAVTLTLTTSAVFLQWRSSLRRALPSHTTPPPRLAPGFLRGTRYPCPLATLPPPLLRQRDPLRRSPQLASPVSVTVLCGEREPTAGFTKTSTVSQLFTSVVSSCCFSAMSLSCQGPLNIQCISLCMLCCIQQYLHNSIIRLCAELLPVILVWKNYHMVVCNLCKHGSCWLSVSCCCSLATVFAFFPIEKECDLNKHCGVLDPERKKLCSRELICNVNSQCLVMAFYPILLPVSLLLVIINRDISLLS